MREIEHAQHAEDDGQAARHQKQQHAEQHAVERGYDDQFKHDAPPWKVRAAFAPAVSEQTADCAMIRAYSAKWVPSLA